MEENADESDLFEFLQGRGVSETNFNSMKEDKINRDVIPLMTDEQLERYLPRYGDRIAAISFCKKTLASSGEKKKGLMERLKARLEDPMSSSSSKRQKQEHDRRSVKQYGNRNAVKQARRVEIGWLDFNFHEKSFKQVKTPKGGGTRHLKLDTDVGMTVVLRESQELFFPNDKSKKGADLSNYTCYITDVSHEKLDDSCTIGSLYEATKMKTLRLYLATKKKVETESASGSSRSSCYDHILTLDVSEDNVTRNAVGPTSQTSNDAIEGQQLERIEPMGIGSVSTGSASSLSNTLACIMNDVGIEVSNEIQNNYAEPSSDQNDADIFPIYHDIGNYVMQDFNGDGSFDDAITFPHLQAGVENIGSVADLMDETILTVRLHRGHVFTELMDFFMAHISAIPKLNIDIVMILPNGESEQGEDNGGLLRDTLSEFWQTLFELCTVGDKIKVPIIRHNMTKEHWTACAAIMFYGYLHQDYFPVQFSSSFLRSITGEETTEEELLKEFNEYLSDMDKELVKRALSDFDSTDQEELLEFFESHEVRVAPTKENVSNIVYEVAHKEMIQAPAYVAKCWTSMMKDFIQPLMVAKGTSFKIIASELTPTTKKVLNCIPFPETTDQQEQAVIANVKHFVKSLNSELLKRFLRFCTGSDLFLNKQIHVRFAKPESDFQRRPIAHTCGCLLELPNNYTDYMELRADFTNILNNAVWIMDIV